MRPRATLALALALAAALALVAGCGPRTDGATTVTLADGSTALVWGDGAYGVVLVPGEGEAPADWSALATEIAANGMTAVAVDPDGVGADRLDAASTWLSERGIERVAFIASLRSGAETIVALARGGGDTDQLILISADLSDEELAALGEPPKLFVAAEDDITASAAVHMTETAAGTWNALLLVPGAHSGLAILDAEGGPALVEGVVARLEERR